MNVACGTNALLARYYRGDGIGVDIVDHGGADLVVEDLARIPLPAQSVDSVAIVASLNYFTDPRGVLAECARILRPEGRIVITMARPLVMAVWHRFREPWAERSAIRRCEIEGMMNGLGFGLTNSSGFMWGMNRVYVYQRFGGAEDAVERQACAATSSQRSIPVFFLSTGRTGSRSIAAILGEAYPGVEAHHVPSGSRFLNVVGTLRSYRWFPDALLTALFAVLRGRSLSACRATHYIDSNPYYYAFPDLLARRIPHARFVHVVRDPRTCVPSFLNWRRHRAKSWMAAHLIPFWEPSGLLAPRQPVRQWCTMNAFERACWRWAYRVSQIEKGLAACDCTCMHIRFEDLFAGGAREQHFRNLVKFLGLPAPESRVEELLATRLNASRKRSFPSMWTEWTDEQCATLSRLCGAAMRTYGYGEEDEWVQKVGRGVQMLVERGK